MVGVMQSAVHKVLDAPDDGRVTVAEAAADFLLRALDASPASAPRTVETA
jgi:hypothetical protein